METENEKKTEDLVHPEEVTETPVVQLDTPDEKSAGRKRRWWVWPLALCLIAAIGIVVVLKVVPAYLYQAAQQALSEGNYTKAVRLFRELGDYEDAEGLAVESENLLTYEQGKEYFDLGLYQLAKDTFASLGVYKDAERLAIDAENYLIYQDAEAYFEAGQYQSAKYAFLSLGNFRDARERLEQVERYARAEEQYLQAKSAYTYGDYIGAYQLLTTLEVPDFSGASTLANIILETLYEMCVRYIGNGERLDALVWLDYLETVDYEPAKELHKSLESTIELDYSFYDALDPQPPGSFTPQTTAEEFAHAYMSMFLSGQTRRTLSARGGAGSSSGSTIDRLFDTIFAGYDLADEWLPEYGSIYGGDVTINVDESNRPVSAVLSLTNNSLYTSSELRTHVEMVDTFCSNSVLELTQAGLLDDNMTHQQKARVIYDWVSYYLTYDDTKKIHDTGMAIQETIGVCESYVGIYNRMCNLAGVPSYSQLGITDNTPTGERHIWTFQLDEEGNVFYTDVTWGDVIFVTFGAEDVVNKPSVEDFLDCYRTYLWEDSWQTYPGEPREGMTSSWSLVEYFWQDTLWDSHTEFHSVEEIMRVF